jgi:hypothetical protein|tara:strand:- start:9 stop:269 length:261 start_codon:yes stop_codon:yes gene_type:complete
MTVFDLDKSITIEFHGQDEIERKMLGLWGDERFKTVNLGMMLMNENVVISMGDRDVTEIPFLVFEQLAVKELAEIIIREAKQKFNL